jgi:hypothetical protein
MTLAAFSAEKRNHLFDELSEGLPPTEGQYDEAIFKEGKDKGKPQIGATRYAPDAIFFEFIYPNPTGAPILLTVSLKPSERIVYMPVPDWVVESVWQGNVAGSYRFESEAEMLLREFASSLESGPNEQLFGVTAPIGRQ